MISSTKITIEKSCLEEIVKSNFNEKERLVSYHALNGGWFNTAYKLKLTSRDVIVKIAPGNNCNIQHYEVGMMNGEYKSLKLLKAHGFKVPDVLFYDVSKSIIPSEYIILSIIQGTTLNDLWENKLISGEEVSSVSYEIGKLNFKINQIKGDRFGYVSDKQPKFNNWFKCIEYLFNDLIKDAKQFNIQLNWDMNLVIKKLHHCRMIFEKVDTPYFVYHDLSEANIFIEKNNIKGIIDPERALFGDPLMENHFMSYCEHNKTFLRGYNNISFEEEGRIKQAFYSFYKGIMMYIETFVREYADDTVRKWIKPYIEKDYKNLNELIHD